MTLVAWVLLFLLCISLIVIAVLVAHISSDSVFGKFFDLVWKACPAIFSKWPQLTKWWARRRIQKQVRRQLKNISDDSFNIDVSIRFCQGDALKTVRDGKRLVVVYHPGQNPAENFINAAMEVSKNCIPNAKSIVTPDLQKCISLTLAKNLIESHSSEYARVFASQFLHAEDGKSHELVSNPYHDKLSALDEKHLFTRVYLKSIIKYGDSFLTLSAPEDLKSTSEKFTKRLAEIGKQFLRGTVPPLVNSSDEVFDPDFGFFFNENGFRINLMLIRSPTAYQDQDVSKYVRKANALVDRGVELNFVLSCVSSIKDVGHVEYLKRVDFAETVTKAIKAQVKGLLFQYESKRYVEYAGLSYPVYCAVFARKPGVPIVSEVASQPQEELHRTPELVE